MMAAFLAGEGLHQDSQKSAQWTEWASHRPRLPRVLRQASPAL